MHFAVSSQILRKNSSASRSMLYFEVQVTFPLPPARLRFIASSHAKRATWRVFFSVITLME